MDAKMDQATMGPRELEPLVEVDPCDRSGHPHDPSAIIGRATGGLRAPAMAIRAPSWLLVDHAMGALLHQRLLAQV